MQMRSMKIVRWMKIVIRVGIALTVLIAAPRAAQAQWASLANALPGRPDTCLLLTDGTVMCHEYRTNHWHRLTPDINGSYINGTWSNLPDMPDGTDASTKGGGCSPCTYAPLFFGSAVLADGRMVVVGGEYNTNGNTWTDIGFMFDPVANSWSAQLTVPFGAGNVGDTQTVILQDGTLLIANISTTNMASYDPSTTTFTALNPTLKNDANDEENWTILPDGRVLTVDAAVGSTFEIYNPATTSWSTSGPTPVNLTDSGGNCNSQEVGPAVARPDGTIIYFTGNPSGQNAVYDINSGNWSHTTGMDFPNITGEGQISAADAPASLLPNGHVLVMASPGCMAIPNTNPVKYTTFNKPSHFYDWDGATLTEVTGFPNAGSYILYQGRMLLLPTGDVLVTAFDQKSTETVRVYTAGGSPQNAWRPVITAGPTNVDPSTSHSISGTLFNGFSDGSSYGDDAQMASNYPLVRFRNHGTGHVFYARTHDHSRMGIEAVGSTDIVTTTLVAPAGLESGPSDLVVVANGIASEPIVVNGPDLSIAKIHSPSQFIQGDPSDSFTITVRNVGATATSGTVTVADVLPASLTATGISGTNWSCSLVPLQCTRNDALAAAGAYDPITITVSVDINAPISVANTATVSGGGQATTVNLTGNDSTIDHVTIRQRTTTTVQTATGDYDDIVTLTATVTTVNKPGGVPGTVQFTVDGSPAGSAVYNSTTGVATLQYLIPLPAGSYSIRADFTSADPLYLDSFGVLPTGLTVTREETSLTYTGDTVIANGGTATMSALLLEDGNPAKPVANRTVTFTLGSGSSIQMCSGVTTSSGIAICLIGPVAQPLGPGVVGSAFAGDTAPPAFYLGSSANATTIVFAFLDSGAMVVGDQTAAIGGPAAFWGSDWSITNQMSGGAAPSAFKGFASNPATQPPTCGIAWTSAQGGNSPKPPATVPSYMGVLVATNVTQSGSTMSGDVLSIIVVQTNAGYSPTPGHPGTGTILAQFCHR